MLVQGVQSHKAIGELVLQKALEKWQVMVQVVQKCPVIVLVIFSLKYSSDSTTLSG
jgi:hypothetical protein